MEISSGASWVRSWRAFDVEGRSGLSVFPLWALLTLPFRIYLSCVSFISTFCPSQWRDATYITIMTIELYILTLPYRPTFLSILLPNFTPYEITHLISKLYISALPAFNLLLQCFQSIGQLSRAGQQQQQQDQTNIIPQDELSKLQEAQLVIQAMEQKIDRIHKLALDVKEESRRSLKNE